MSVICENTPELSFPELPELGMEEDFGLKGSPVPPTPSPWGARFSMWSPLKRIPSTPSPTYAESRYPVFAPSWQPMQPMMPMMAPQQIPFPCWPPAPVEPTPELVIAALMAEAEALASIAAELTAQQTAARQSVDLMQVALQQASQPGSGRWVQHAVARGGAEESEALASIAAALTGSWPTDAGKQAVDRAGPVLEQATQHGSGRWVQRAVAAGDAGVLDVVLREAPQLARHRHGKDALIAVLERASKDHQRALVDVLRGEWLELATDVHACRMVQRLMEICDDEIRLPVVVELQGHLEDLLDHKYGNHVAHRVSEHCGPSVLALLLPEAAMTAADLARHPYGCRVLQHLIERCPASLTADLIATILEDQPALACHPFGNYVVQCVLKQGSVEHRWGVARAVCEHLEEYCDNKFASNVVEAVVRWCPEAADLVIDAAMRSSTSLVGLSSLRYGNFVVQRLLEVRGKHRTDLVEALVSGPRLQGFGKHVQAALNKMTSK
eukprot:CAMPEP_0204321948 /NCGR_PEP_ID=MMETSP0469-20131031/8425_1 /ASSEMBLY_ACC=CAM_ASM_000384 /TAXON_ID=2969 /ORGANISM="Oxyrrhis marina" /LENGTH=497 /DNA_ID=CAMNT_0051303271 /DNA_START=34 /DNA_END=1527 /DNA_ORIENTATION=+